MTRVYFCLKEDLFNLGASYAGYRTQEEIYQVLRVAKTSESIIANPLAPLLDPEKDKKLIRGLTNQLEVKTIPIKGMGPMRISIGVGTFRGGLELWFINPRTGAGRRL